MAASDKQGRRKRHTLRQLIELAVATLYPGAKAWGYDKRKGRWEVKVELEDSAAKVVDAPATPD